MVLDRKLPGRFLEAMDRSVNGARHGREAGVDGVGANVPVAVVVACCSGGVPVNRV